MSEKLNGNTSNYDNNHKINGKNATKVANDENNGAKLLGQNCNENNQFQELHTKKILREKVSSNNFSIDNEKFGFDEEFDICALDAIVKELDDNKSPDNSNKKKEIEGSKNKPSLIGNQFDISPQELDQIVNEIELANKNNNFMSDPKISNYESVKKNHQDQIKKSDVKSQAILSTPKDKFSLNVDDIYLDSAALAEIDQFMISNTKKISDNKKVNLNEEDKLKNSKNEVLNNDFLDQNFPTNFAEAKDRETRACKRIYDSSEGLFRVTANYKNFEVLKKDKPHSYQTITNYYEVPGTKHYYILEVFS